jgi:hypothetical protein
MPVCMSSYFTAPRCRHSPRTWQVKSVSASSQRRTSNALPSGCDHRSAKQTRCQARNASNSLYKRGQRTRNLIPRGKCVSVEDSAYLGINSNSEMAKVTPGAIAVRDKTAIHKRRRGLPHLSSDTLSRLRFIPQTLAADGRVGLSNRYCGGLSTSGALPRPGKLARNRSPSTISGMSSTTTAHAR